MRQISVRAQLLIFGGLAFIFVIALLNLRPARGELSDQEYITMAKATSQGQLYFKKYDASCEVIRVWSVQVNCDYVPPGARATEKFRVYIDARTSAIIEVEAQFTP